MRERLVLLALDELDPVVDQVRGEVFELLFAQLDLLETVDDLVVGEEALFLPGLDELVQLLDLGKRDIDRQHLTPTSGLMTQTRPQSRHPHRLPRPTLRDSTSRFRKLGDSFF